VCKLTHCDFFRCAYMHQLDGARILLCMPQAHNNTTHELMRAVATGTVWRVMESAVRMMTVDHKGTRCQNGFALHSAWLVHCMHGTH
jgi:hypothetical protein